MPYASYAEIQRARRLRGEMTDAELHLWKRLRGKQMGGHRFRRQVPVGPYVVDFACLGARLAIEVDGGHHAADRAQDDRRTTHLQSQGFTVLRFWDNDVLQQTDSVLESIRTALLTPPSPLG